MGSTGLRKLKRKEKGEKLSDGKVLGGKGRLTDKVIGKDTKQLWGSSTKQYW